jgi:hypothetical protein
MASLQNEATGKQPYIVNRDFNASVQYLLPSLSPLLAMDEKGHTLFSISQVKVGQFD